MVIFNSYVSLPEGTVFNCSEQSLRESESQRDPQADDFSADEYDVDGSGAVGWYEFVTVWRKAVPCWNS